MVRGGGDQQDRRYRGREEGDEEDVALELGDARPAVRERDGEQEREQHLHAGEHDAELVEELDQLAVEIVLVALLGVGHAPTITRVR